MRRRQGGGGEWSRKPESGINKHFAERDILKDAADKSRVTKRNTGIRSDVNVEEKEQKWIMITVTVWTCQGRNDALSKRENCVFCVFLSFSHPYYVTGHEDNKTVALETHLGQWRDIFTSYTRQLFGEACICRLRWLRGFWPTCSSPRNAGFSGSWVGLWIA